MAKKKIEAHADALQQRIQNLETLLEISEIVNSTLDLDEILQQITRQAVKALKATRAVLFLHEKSEDDFVTLASEFDERDLQESKKTGRYEMSKHSMNKQVMATLQPIQFHVDDPAIHLDGKVRASFQELQIRSVLMVPLIRGERALGLFAVDQAYNERVFTDEDIRLARIFANQTVIAMKNAELFRTLQDEKRQIEAVIQSSWDGIVVIDRQDQIKLINNSFVTAFGVAREHVIGKKLPDFLAEIRYTMEIDKAPRTENDAPQKYRVYSDDSNRYFQAVRSSFAFDMMTDTGSILVFRDVTYEENLQKMREDLTQMVVHDLKNPLAATMAYVESVTSGVLGEVNPRQKEFLQRAYNNSNLLLNMIGDILDLNRAEAKEVSLKLCFDSVKKVVKEAIFQLESEQTARKIIVQEFLSDTPNTGYDPDIITRVCVNLLHNAYKFSSANGIVQVFLEADAHNVYVKIKDHGPGIPEKYHEKVFEKFVQVGDSEIKHRLSSGLGLTFCKIMVEEHKGKVWVESEVGKGSTFIFTLPILEQTA